MKRFILASYAILMLVNLLAKLIFSYYHWFNFGLSSLILLNTALVLYMLASRKIPDGFRVSLSLVFAVIGFVMFILAQFSPIVLRDNWIIFLLTVTCAIIWGVYLLVRAAQSIVKE